MRSFLICTSTFLCLNFISLNVQAITLPPTTGLQGWFRADTGITTVSGKVSLWNDQSGNLNHATQTTANARPTLSSALMPSGLMEPILAYGNNSDGSFDQLNLPNINQDAGTGGTVYMIINDDADDSTTVRTWLNRDAPSPPYAPAAYGNPSSTTDAGIYYDTNFHANAPNGVTGWKMGRFSWTGTGSATLITDFLSSQTGADLSDAPDNTTTWVSIGAGAAVSSQATQFSVAEILIYDRALTPAEDLQVLAYLETKFFTEPIPPAPEPSSLMLLVLGMGLQAVRRHIRGGKVAFNS